MATAVVAYGRLPNRPVSLQTLCCLDDIILSFNPRPAHRMTVGVFYQIFVFHDSAKRIKSPQNAPVPPSECDCGKSRGGQQRHRRLLACICSSTLVGVRTCVQGCCDREQCRVLEPSDAHACRWHRPYWRFKSLCVCSLRHYLWRLWFALYVVFIPWRLVFGWDNKDWRYGCRIDRRGRLCSL